MAQLTLDRKDRKDRIGPVRADQMDRKDRTPFRGSVFGPGFGLRRRATGGEGAGSISAPPPAGNRPVPHADNAGEKTIFKMKDNT